MVAVDGDDEGEADGGFGGGDCDGKYREDYPGVGGGRDLRGVTPEGDEVDVGGVEHQLDAEEHEDGVAAGERGGEA